MMGAHTEPFVALTSNICKGAAQTLATSITQLCYECMCAFCVTTCQVTQLCHVMVCVLCDHLVLQWKSREDGKDHDTIKPLARMVSDEPHAVRKPSRSHVTQ
jgi:hypothetical protein